MKFKVGDFVRFIDERREGYVTTLISDDMVGVTDQDGFEITVATSNLTTVHGHTAAPKGDKTDVNNAAQAADVTSTPARVLANDDDKPGYYLVVTTAPQTPDVAYIHFLNNYNNTCLLSIALRTENGASGIYCGIMAAGQMELVHTARLNSIDLWPAYIIQAINHPAERDSDVKKPEYVVRKFTAKDFAGSKVKLAGSGQAWVIPLNAPLLINAQALKQSMQSPKVVGHYVPKPKREVDLHIEKLEADYSKLNATQILNVQIEHFNKNLDAAIANGMDSIVFIHGIGNGSLKKALEKNLASHPKVAGYSNADNEKYGYGATKVQLK